MEYVGETGAGGLRSNTNIYGFTALTDTLNFNKVP